MTDGQWRRVWELYEQAHALSPAEARAFLDSVPDDAEIVREVVGALAASMGPVEPAEAREWQHTGQVVGRYEVGQPLGKGGTGEVYSGRDTLLDRPVALKFIGQEYAGVASVSRRFFREAQAASALNHPNIITVYEIMVVDTAPVIVMELVDGVPMRQLCGRPMPETQVRRIGSQIAQALATAHERGIIHRDLKPENVMVRPDGYAKVLDFGLAKVAPLAAAVANFTSTRGMAVGTLRYMSPEQCRGEVATPASDVFSLGICLYEMYTGVHPFAGGGSAIDSAYAIISAEAKPISESGALNGVILRMLAKDPGLRPSAQEVAQTLGAPGEDMATPRITRRWAAVPIVGALAAGAGFWWLSSHRGRDPILLKGGDLRDPVFSPDGTRLAFSWKAPSSASFSIFIIRAGGGMPVRITNSASHDIDPAWSRDGSRLSFVRQGLGECALYVIDSIPGARETRIVTLTFRDYSGRADWLTNNSLVVADLGTSNFRLFTIDLESRERRDIVTPPINGLGGDNTPRCSPDGRLVAFNRFTTQSSADLHVVPVGGGEVRRLTFDQEQKRDFRWTPDGRGLLFRKLRERKSLFFIGLDGSAVRQIDLPVTVWGSFGLARGENGTIRIACAESPLTATIWRADLPGTGGAMANPVPFISSAKWNLDVNPVISPDGLRVAFVSNRSGSAQIWVSDNEGKRPRQLSTFPRLDLSPPAWSPDGRQIVTSAPLQGRGALMILDATGTNSMRVIEQEGDNFEPQFSADGRAITFSSGREGVNLWSIPVAGGKPRRLTRGGGLVHRASLDGKWIYYVRRAESGLWRIPAQGGEEKLVLSRVSSELYRAWAVGREGIYYTVEDTAAGQRVILFLNLKDGTHKPICRLTKLLPRWTGTLSISRDERWMAFPLEEAEESRLSLHQGIRL